MKEATKSQLKVARALMGMPYGGGLFPRVEAKKITLDFVGEHLQLLAARLREVSAEARKDAEELHRLRSDLATFRRVLGTAS